MADHARVQLRAAAILALTGLATTGARVFEDRIRDYTAGELPALNIETPSEDAPPAGYAGIVARDTLLSVTGTAKLADGIAATLDAIAKEVETALAAGLVAGSATVRLDYAGMNRSYDDSTDLPVGAIELRFRAQLFTSAPDVILNG